MIAIVTKWSMSDIDAIIPPTTKLSLANIEKPAIIAVIKHKLENKTNLVGFFDPKTTSDFLCLKTTDQQTEHGLAISR